MKKIVPCARNQGKAPLLRRLSRMLFCLLLLSPQLHAQDAGKQKVSLQADNQPLEDIFHLLERQTGFTFAYNSREIKDKLEERFSFKETNRALPEILDVITKRTGLQFKQSGRIVSVQKGADQVTPAPKRGPGKVTGKIIDEENGQPVPGATIRIGNTGTTTGEDGSFSVFLPKGSYTAIVSYLGYGTKEVNEIEVRDNQPFELNVVLKRKKGQLAGITVVSSARKEGVAALYTRQKNTAEISNGISSEQISATPDKNVGEVLKRISGVSTNDNRRVVIRGIAERYNVAMLDGVTLPSTDVQVRDFEFDIIPSNLIDNIIVSKGYTPDMSFGFGGGLVQINTLTIPTKNFTSINFGGKYNDASTGKEFLGYKRGKQDYLGFDDGGRKDRFPDDLFYFQLDRYNPNRPYENVTPPGSGLTPITPEMIAEQNKKIGGTERLGTRIYTARPSQNYQFSLGRTYSLGKGRLGFVGSASYRNEQSIDDISHFERGNWSKNGNNSYDAETGEEIHGTTSKQYNFSTTWAALVNGGWQTKNHKIITRNFYSRGFQSRFIRTEGWGNDIGFGDDPAVLENDSPKFIELLQNKLTGEHKFGHFVIDWNLAKNKIANYEYDAVEAGLGPEKTANSTVYTYAPNNVTDPGVGAFNRAQYKYDESNLMADVALSYHFRAGNQDQKIKAGYQYLERHGKYEWDILPIGSLNGNRYSGIPVHEWTKYFDFKDPLNDIYYYPGGFSLNNYEGKNTNAAFFGMVDNRITKWLRLVWGMRIESYVYEEIKDATSTISQTIEQQAEAKRRYINPETGELVHKYLDAATEEQKWRYLPSANLTVTPLPNVNIRASYAQSVVRPSLIENSGFSRLNPTIGRIQHNTGVLSTIIDHYDTKLEWYPAVGEVISVGYFYKYFKNPVELYLDVTNSSQSIDAITGNSDWAKVKGFEFDLRKSLGFLYSGWKPLQNIYLSGNLTLQNSEVQASRFEYQGFGEGPYDKEELNYSYRKKTLLREKRPLYGQVPVLYNIGLLYNDDRLSLNIVFNHMGYKTFTVGMRPEYVEYERPRGQTDAQISYTFLKNRSLKVKLNMSNLFDNPHRFYINSGATYKEKDNMKNVYGFTEWSERYEWKFGFSEKYEEGYYETAADGKTKTRIGDIDTFTRRVGRSFSFSVSYSL
ncbi:TonB-dependent receptor domain-containing protein [Chitinophaga ginsengisegetis]|uniref:TonB-dependent receptor domain-containing protein n=1 Tax=Chitinophaga ginsengisegetis TaxID=393003 RepID=UPI000DBF71CD|nr:TonB-dependent receptor [Chitinophaga ginsengisegetis]MDR6568327.1 outer membrane receptor protein involved in Fe transport [Chitinophaga ginsengisegetis]MDR6648442.1 outer membrane receptor protein involved in Fe transport [Chitinophaga ginsengisegetis]MDR6654408.1 outer membrane receptor protein involved in Fe transport [Chitinophaga ginsengisegetis]